MIKVGDTRYEQPSIMDAPRRGRVVYVHPLNRWYAVEFQCERLGVVRKYRESFFLPVKHDIHFMPDRGKNRR